MNFIKQKQIKLSLLSLSLITFMGCTHNSKIVFPNRAYKNIQWTKAEKEKNIVLKHLARNKYSSSHLIRIKGSEVPHYHDTHNLTVTIISGKSIIHFKEHEVILDKGDVVTIPKGIYHWAENIDSEASIVFATFSPAFNGTDTRLIK